MRIPIIKADIGYLVGTDIQFPIMKGKYCVVKTDGGYVNFEEYIMKRHKEYFETLKFMMKESQKSFHEVLSTLLLKLIKDRKKILDIMKKLQFWIVR